MRRSATVVAAAMALLGVVGCGEDDPAETAQDPPTTTTPADDDRSTESSPFTMDPPSEGFVARSAGTGSAEPGWGEDSFGTDQPYLVLSPDGTADHPGVVLVALTGYRGYQGGLDQASGGYGATEITEVGGEEARFAPALAVDETDDFVGVHWADLVVAHGEDDVAIRVTSPEATEDELAAFVEHVVVPEDHAQPPSMPDPPDGYEVLGAVDAYAVIAAQSDVDQQADGGPGPVGAHSVGWLDGGEGSGDQLAVMALPGRAADLDALAVGLRWQEQRIGEVAVEQTDDDHITVERLDELEHGSELERSVWRATPGGDLVVAVTRGKDSVALDALVALVDSVTPTDDATWEAFVGEVRGGPGLHADPGRTELMRGMVGDGRGWLLQDQPPGEGNLSTSDLPEGGWSVDPCLVLTGGDRACPGSEASRTGVWAATGRAEDGLAFVIVATTAREAESLAVSDEETSWLVPLAPVPGTDQKAAAVVGDGYVVDACLGEAPEQARTIALVEADGDRVGCRP